MGCPEAELSIVVTDDTTIHALNRVWRGKDKPTDVLSFSQLEGEQPEKTAAKGRSPKRRAIGTGVRRPAAPAKVQAVRRQQPILGDVVISEDTAARQAADFGHSFDAEMRRLLVHGVLHLLGHDHAHGGLQARRMREEERRLLRALGQQAQR